jgi:hypothetical protein
MALRQWFTGTSCALLFAAMVAPAHSNPIGGTVSSIKSAAAASGLTSQQVAYRICAVNGARRCRLVNIYGPGVNGSNAPGVYGYSAPRAGYTAPRAYGYGAPGAYGYSAPGAYGYGAPRVYGYSDPRVYGYGAPRVYGYGAPGVYGYGAPGVYGYSAPSAAIVPVGPVIINRYPNEYRPTDPDDYPVGTNPWWRGMDRLDRGGRSN